MDHENPEVPEEDRLEELEETDTAAANRLDAEAAAHQHDDERADEWEEESFPASDPPANY